MLNFKLIKEDYIMEKRVTNYGKKNTLDLYRAKDEFITPFGRLFDDLFKHQFSDFDNIFGLDFFNSSSYPKVDIIEYDDHVKLEAEIIGLTEDEIKLQLNDETLCIIGNKQNTNEDTAGKYITREIKRSSFQRSFKLDADKLDLNDITAKYENNLLVIDIPKKIIDKNDKRKEIKINMGE
jgi:HSP20 family protein